MRRTLLMAILCFLGGFGMSHAEETKPCLIFSGMSESKHVLDLEKFNRITFGENSMTVTHSDHPENQIELLYSAFHRFELGDGVSVGVEEIETDTDLSFLYDRKNISLKLYTGENKEYSLGIFNTNGVLIFRTVVTGGENISVESLEPGVYIAIAINEDKEMHKLKFVR